MMKPFTPEEIKLLAAYVHGHANAMQDPCMSRVAEFLDEAADLVCAQGFIGCDGGRECQGDHK